jgi:hypothetical protein
MLTPDEVRQIIMETSEDQAYWQSVPIAAGRVNAYDALAATGVSDNAAASLAARLRGNYPNPFNPLTTIGYELTAPSEVTLAIHSVSGRHVATLVLDGYFESVGFGRLARCSAHFREDATKPRAAGRIGPKGRAIPLGAPTADVPPDVCLAGEPTDRLIHFEQVTHLGVGRGEEGSSAARMGVTASRFRRDWEACCRRSESTRRWQRPSACSASPADSHS